MGVGGKFSEISIQDFSRFAERHDIPYSRKLINEVKYAVSKWPDFAKQAGLSKVSTDKIKEELL